MHSFTKTALNAYKARALAKTFGLQTEGPAWKWALRQLRKGRTPEQITGALNQKERRLLRRRARATKTEHALTLGKDRNVQTGYVKGEKYQVEPKPATSSTIATGHAHPKYTKSLDKLVRGKEQSLIDRSTKGYRSVKPTVEWQRRDLGKTYREQISKAPKRLKESAYAKDIENRLIELKTPKSRTKYMRQLRGSIDTRQRLQTARINAPKPLRGVTPSPQDLNLAATRPNITDTIATPGSPYYSTYKYRPNKFKAQGGVRTVYFKELPKIKQS